MSALAQRVRSQPGHVVPARLGPPTGPRIGGNDAQNEYIKVRSVACDRAGSVGTRPVPAADPRVPQAHIDRTAWACRPHAVRASAGKPAATRFPVVVFSDLTQLAVAEPERARAASEPAWRDPPENSTAVSVVLMPAGFSAPLVHREHWPPFARRANPQNVRSPRLPSRRDRSTGHRHHER